MCAGALLTVRLWGALIASSGWALYRKAYLVNVLQQINDWLMAKSLQKLVLVITAVGSKEVLER